jgi:hypothetical protein
LIRAIALLGLLLAGRVLAAQSTILRIDDAGPGIGPRILVDALSRPYDVAPRDTGRYLVTRTSDNPRTLVVLGRDVVIEGRVKGDVVVISGDLYMHPGGAVEGRALAFGGGVYESSLASIAGGARAFRDFTYDLAPIPGGYALRYRSLVDAPPTGLILPGVYGIASPEYDRSDGLSIGFAPRYAFRGRPIVLAPKLTYRSQLGEIDPSLAVDYRFGRRTLVSGRVERATRSNDRWIRTDLLNSANFFWSGKDTRNYYRANSGEVRLAQTWESVHNEFVPFVGARFEDGSSVRPGPDVTGGPWTVLNRGDSERDDRLRPNPAIDDGNIYSGLLGGTWRWNDGAFLVRTRLDGEIGVLDPNATASRSTFGQATIAAHVEFPTFSQQSLLLDGHFVASTAGRTPRQRFAYFGGPGTFPMLDLFEEGGDDLVFIDTRYVIPMHWFNLPFVGMPAFTLRELLGGAAVGAFPRLHQAVGARVAVKVFYAEVLYDPDLRRGRGGVGLSLTP